MSNQCNQCGSYAINHHHHGRDGSDPDLCDVCYWHTRHARLQTELAALKAKAAVPDCVVTVLPDGSAFGVMSFPLAETHWLYAEREYEEGADEPKELTAPILNHAEHGNIVEAAARYAVRGATNCGKWPDFDPDALVQNVTYALCGPFNKSATALAKHRGER